MGVVRWILTAAALLLITVLVARVPDDVFRVTQALLLVAAALILLFVALGVFLVPVRAALARAFALPLTAPPGGLVALPPEEEMKTTFRPLLVAGACLAVALVGQLLR